MNTEKTQLKFAESEDSKELIAFVYRHPRKRDLRGVFEDFRYGKQICVLSEELKGTVQPNKLYDVELKRMHSNNGYVVVKATPKLFPAEMETTIVPNVVYKVTITFGYKVVYFDPKDGKSAASRTLPGVIKLLREREDLENPELIIEELKKQAKLVVHQMEQDGYYVPEHTLK